MLLANEMRERTVPNESVRALAIENLYYYHYVFMSSLCMLYKTFYTKFLEIEYLIVYLYNGIEKRITGGVD